MLVNAELLQCTKMEHKDLWFHKQYISILKNPS